MSISKVRIKFKKLLMKLKSTVPLLSIVVPILVLKKVLLFSRIVPFPPQFFLLIVSIFCMEEFDEISLFLPLVSSQNFRHTKRV
jgi:hypothetical protein